MLEEYIGNYYSDELDIVWRVEAQDEGLVMQVGINSKFELQLIAEDSFSADSFLGVFQRGADGAVNRAGAEREPDEKPARHSAARNPLSWTGAMPSSNLNLVHRSVGGETSEEIADQ